VYSTGQAEGRHRLVFLKPKMAQLNNNIYILIALNKLIYNNANTNTYVYSSQGQTIKYKCKDRDRQNKNQIKKACHTT